MTDFKIFLVSVTPTIPTWDLREYEVEICARTRADAIREARSQYRENWLDWGHGSATYRAKEVQAAVYD